MREEKFSVHYPAVFLQMCERKQNVKVIVCQHKGDSCFMLDAGLARWMCQ